MQPITTSYIIKERYLNTQCVLNTNLANLLAAAFFSALFVCARKTFNLTVRVELLALNHSAHTGTSTTMI